MDTYNTYIIMYDLLINTTCKLMKNKTTFITNRMYNFEVL